MLKVNSFTFTCAGFSSASLHFFDLFLLPLPVSIVIAAYLLLIPGEACNDAMDVN